MKKFLAILLAFLLVMPLAAFAMDLDLTKLTDEELTKLNEAIVTEQQNRIKGGKNYLLFKTYDQMNIGITGVEVLKDGDKKILVVKYDFSHNSPDPASSLFSAGFVAYQDGKELDPSLFYEHPTMFNLATEIKKGEVIEVSKGFLLISDSPVEIHVSKLLNFSGAAPDVITVELPK